MNEAIARIVLPDGCIQLTKSDDGVAVLMRDADGLNGFGLDVPLAHAAYIAGWLSVMAGIDLAGLTAGAAAAGDARQRAAADDDARTRWGAH